MMDLLKELLNQYPIDEPPLCLVCGENSHRDEMDWLCSAIHDIIMESFSAEAPPETKLYNGPYDGCAVSEVNWQLLMASSFEDWPCYNLVNDASREVLLIPVFDCSIHSLGVTPAWHVKQNSNFLHIADALIHVSVLPILLTSAYAPSLAVTRLVASALKAQGYSSLVGVMNADTQSRANPESYPLIQVVERWAPMNVAILAAGQSSRMGRSKQLERINDVPMVVQAVTTAIHAGADRVILVIGAYAQGINKVLADSGIAEHSALHLLHNSHYAEGQSTSVKAVISHILNMRKIERRKLQPKGKLTPQLTNVAPSLAAIIFMPVDQPFLQSSLLVRLFKLWRHGSVMAAPSVAGKPRGAPALFDNQFWAEFEALSGDVGAKVLLRRYVDQLTTIEVQPEYLLDIDTPADIP